VPCYVKAYKQFAHIKAKKEDWNAEIMSPSIAVDKMWHQRILDNVNDYRDSVLLSGNRTECTTWRVRNSDERQPPMPFWSVLTEIVSLLAKTVCGAKCRRQHWRPLPFDSGT
jgi:hypothetical protein